MKKIKQMRIKAILLTIVAVLTLGFTSCTDELASDQTQGKPGYLTINVKTLKPKQTKVGGDNANADIQKINNLNIFVFTASGNKLIHNYNTTAVTTGTADLNIPVSTLPAGAEVVVVANYNSDLTAITTLAGLEDLDIVTVGDFATNGLHMTGKANIESLSNGSYITQVKIAPVEAKITVTVNPSTYISDNYLVTGIYIVNAINKTKLPIIRNNIFVPVTTLWTIGASNVLPSNFINLPTTRTASTGLVATNGKDFNFYFGMTLDISTTNDLKDENVLGLTGPFHYYVGENYSYNAPIAANGGSIAADAAGNSAHANTLVVIKVSPTATGITNFGAGDKYYTYEFTKTSTGLTGVNIKNLGVGVIGPDDSGVGFSVRRKTNYNLTFNLTSVGSINPYERSRMLNVVVEAEAWDTPVITF